MRRFRVSPLPEIGAETRLDTANSHHLLEVIRHARGEPLMLWDGAGNQAPAILADVADRCAIVRVTGPMVRAAPRHAVHVILGLPKGPAADLSVRMGVEAGATHLHMVWAAHTQGRPNKTERWQRIAASAAQQCARADLPTVFAPETLAQALSRLPEGIDLRVATPGAAACCPPTDAAAIAIGPEGGWSPTELRQLLEAGATAMGLGPWILRTDTAVAVATAQLCGPPKP